MTGKLYGVGVGPGDPELLTLKAMRIIRESDVIALPGPRRRWLIRLWYRLIRNFPKRNCFQSICP